MGKVQKPNNSGRFSDFFKMFKLFTSSLASYIPCIHEEYLGRAVIQAVSRWLPTFVARVCGRAACGICGGQSGTEAGFLRVLRFPLPIIISQISPSS
jgi:hypothetical protein